MAEQVDWLRFEYGAEKALREQLGDLELETFSKFVSTVDEDGMVEERYVPYRFKLIPNEVGWPKSMLYQVIMESGGTFTLEDDDDYAVKILNDLYFVLRPEEDPVLPSDVYSSSLIFEAIKNHKAKLPFPDPGKHLVTPSRYPSGYDLLKILKREQKWTDLPNPTNENLGPVTAQDVAYFDLDDLYCEKLVRSPQTPPKEPATEEPSKMPVTEEPSKMPDAEELQKMSVAEELPKMPVTEESPEAEANHHRSPVKMVVKGFAGPSNMEYALNRKNRKPEGEKPDLSTSEVEFDDGDSDAESTISKGPKRPFNIKDDIMILKMICGKKAFMYTGGLRIFTQMANSKVFNGKRTANSLNHRWRKFIKPNILDELNWKQYGISKENLMALRKGINQAKMQSHSNVAPDYDFDDMEV